MSPTLASYRGDIAIVAMSEIKTRYAETAIVMARNVVHLLMVALVLGAVLGGFAPRTGQGAKNGVDRAVYVATGLIPRLAFADGVGCGTHSLIEHAVFVVKRPILREVYVVKTTLCSSMGALIRTLALSSTGRRISGQFASAGMAD